MTNTGNRAATEVVQCYVRNLGASIEQPVRSLRASRASLSLPANPSRSASRWAFNELSFINLESAPAIEPTHYTVWIGGSSLANQHAGFVVTP